MTTAIQDTRRDATEKTPLKSIAVSTPVFGLMTSNQVAAALALSNKTLAAWRSSGRSPLPFLRLGSRVRYRSEDVLAWLESRMCSAATDAARGPF
ncbi:DNA-binding protein [Pseudomonas sp. FW306-02-F02-AA]|uniref:helix-turn-helix domain-containing protein n=2 Tax=Pseudomonas TaxID=286 RepID=UPI0009BD74ED|nr:MULTISPECIES: helix-turn-helix domain-containing protein [unclassified Pseudomonas]PMZ01718.1 DNA-binding protein [Pseudomonas sp. FW306-02-F02-AB]PMZ07613.1 DNA-binding protein [Pseudomonas sp. FW306-02-H06C]PMZ29343.1 DNA-binding protein [Pseudomonas sp. FW306-02-F04-BA]PMZ44225.1 DNA-binding protein [Pseudomonas sp. FW306-02-H05-AA]PMZ50407.1 DNA-binding protein [Pseudomonas sp. FW306-2-11AC]PMZ56624.1 DNA-binding protein [Pseudomonas sp. FW300-N1A5]PMZ62491.1 DNA-binding protein [Pseu